MKKIIVGVSLFALLLVFSLCFSSFSNDIDLAKRLESPTLSAPFGYDTLGRNLLERVAAGVLVSLGIAIVVSVISILFGVLLAYFMSKNGIISSVFSVLANTLKVVPSIILAIFLVASFGSGSVNLIIALSVSMVSNVARTIYSKIMVIEKEQYIKVAAGFGIGRTRIFITHILLELFPYLREQALSIMLSSIVSEASLSYLGCGVAVTTPSLGSILAEARPFFLAYPYLVIFPAIILFMLGLSLSLISSGIREKSELYSTS